MMQSILKCCAEINPLFQHAEEILALTAANANDMNLNCTKSSVRYSSRNARKISNTL